MPTPKTLTDGERMAFRVSAIDDGLRWHARADEPDYDAIRNLEAEKRGLLTALVGEANLLRSRGRESLRRAEIAAFWGESRTARGLRLEGEWMISQADAIASG